MFPVSGRIPTPPIYVPSDPTPPPDLSGYVTTQQLMNALASTPPPDLSGYVTTQQLSNALASHSGKSGTGLFTNSNRTMTDADWDRFIGMIPISPSTTLTVTDPTSGSPGRWTMVCNFGSTNMNVVYPMAGVFGKNSNGVIQNGESTSDVLAPGRVMLIVYAGHYMGWAKYMVHYY